MRQIAIRWLIFILCFGELLTGCAGRKQEFLLSAVKQTQTENTAEEESPPDSGRETAGSREDEEKVRETPAILVDVCGAVRNPGVYELPKDSRVFEAVRMAGGFTVEACPEAVNQAQQMTDGQQLYIPTVQEMNTSERGEYLSSGNSSAAETEKVNINTADKETLMTLNGIGETRADAILLYRREHGPFSSVEDLLRITGIKEGTLAKIRDRIVTG